MRLLASCRVRLLLRIAAVVRCDLPPCQGKISLQPKRCRLLQRNQAPGKPISGRTLTENRRPLVVLQSLLRLGSQCASTDML
ncbi:hypothetical protein GUJ93_ZPchr0001g29919 [Zizania palustris]|uniref:Secreted protein n=1 Tax=Zizania palustris TaxID=103762 RepID=A0A8J5RQ97_ZIZPA|nr:hypothetical protein GUJ93_ZPchr0001g29919 [Zizania palustris]